MREITRAELEQWRANPVTKLLFDDIAEAIQEAREQPRIAFAGYGDQVFMSSEQTLLMNANTNGLIEGYQELDGWYQGKLEEDEVNEDEETQD